MSLLGGNIRFDKSVRRSIFLLFMTVTVAYMS